MASKPANLSSTHLDQRRRIHDQVAARLGALSDEQLTAALADQAVTWRDSVHGSQSGAIDVDGVKVFVKMISLTDLERAADNEGSTANLFDLPLFYQYGVGSAGFGAWREALACLKASAWALSGECPYFPLVYHWRVLPRTAPVLAPRQIAWLDRAVAYWDGSYAVGARLDAIANASASIALFCEYVPEAMNDWLGSGSTGEPPDAAREALILRFHDQWQGARGFMNDSGMLHFDLNGSNVLTDDQQIYVADFGLAICSDFDLSPAERAFYETHRLYDRAYVTWAFAEWLTPRETPRTLTPALTALIDDGAPIADFMRTFLGTLGRGSKTTPYPATELEAAFAAHSGR